jgi:hypothetical protein
VSSEKDPEVEDDNADAEDDSDDSNDDSDFALPPPK